MHLEYILAIRFSFSSWEWHRTLLVSKLHVLVLYKFECDIVLEIIFTCWMCNCSSQFLSINMRNDLLISPPTSLLLSPCRLSAWWPRRWCRDTRRFSLKGVSQGKSSRSTSALSHEFLCGWCVGNDCVSQTGILYFTVTHKRMTTTPSCKCVAKLLSALPEINLYPLWTFLLLNYAMGYLWKANGKDWSNACSLSQLQRWPVCFLSTQFTMSALNSSQLIQK